MNFGIEKIPFGVNVAVCVVGIIFLYYWTLRGILVLAEKHILIYRRKNGTAVPVYSKGGGIVRIDVLYYGHNYDPMTGDMTKLDIKEIKKRGKLKSFLMSLFWLEGLKWLGPACEVKKREHKWPTYKQKEEDGKIIFKPVQEKDNQIFIWLKDDTYYTLLEKVEIKGMGEVDIATLWSVRVVNPNKTTRVENWLTVTLEMLASSSRDHLAKYTYEQVTGTLAKTDKMEQDQIFKNLGEIRKTAIAEKTFQDLKKEKLLKWLKEEYGVEIFKLRIVEIELAGLLAEKYKAASIKVYEATKGAESDIITAHGKAQVVGIGATAEENRIEKVYKKIEEFGDLGRKVRFYEALENSTNKIIMTTDSDMDSGKKKKSRKPPQINLVMDVNDDQQKKDKEGEK